MVGLRRLSLLVFFSLNSFQSTENLLVVKSDRPLTFAMVKHFDSQTRGCVLKVEEPLIAKMLGILSPNYPGGKWNMIRLKPSPVLILL